MSNRVNLTLDIMKASIKNPLITVRQGEGNFETLRATVTANGEPLDLQGFTITFMGTTAGKHKIVDGNVTLVDASNGIFEYTPSKAWGMDVGGFKIAYFKFISGDGSTSSANFQVEVIEAVDLTQQEAQNYISVVDATISEIDKHLNDSLAKVTQSIAETSSVASLLSVNVSSVASSAVNQINDTASSTTYNVNSVASNAVNNVSVTASGAIDSVNNTASNAVNNVNVTASNAINSITSSVTALGNRVEDYNNKLAYIQVGGRNLLLGTTDWKSNNFEMRGTLTSAKFGGLTIAETSGAWNSPRYSLISLANQGYIKTGTPYVFSTYVRNTSDNTIKVAPYGNPTIMDGTGTIKTVEAHGDWKQVYTVFNFKEIPSASNSTGNNAWIRWETGDAVVNGKLQFAGYKLEQGNVPTDWSPAPEDAPSNDAQLVHKTGTETIAGDKTFTGNTTLSTTTILSGNYGLRVTASGIQKTTDGKNWVSANI